MTTLEKKLEEQIGEAVAEYLKASQAAATAAMERAFGSSGATRARAPKSAPGQRRNAPKRDRAEMEKLSNALDEAVRAKPGETMKTLAQEVGAAPRELQVPVARLKRAGRIRTVGQRQFTRYYPTTMQSQAEA